MGDQIANFPKVFLGDQNGKPGHLRMNQMGLAFRLSTGDQQIIKVPADAMDRLAFLRAARDYELRAQLKDGTVYKFDGLEPEDFATIQRYAKQYFNVPLERRELSLRGWNWGQTAVRNNYVTFASGNKAAFELPLKEVANVTTPSKSEVAVEMRVPAAAPDDSGRIPTSRDDALVEIRFYIPGGAEVKPDVKTEVKTEVKVEPRSGSEEESAGETPDDEVTAASLFFDSIKEFADIGVVAGDSLCSFDDLLCLTPRGRFTLDLYENCLRLRGKSHDYRVAFDAVQRIFSVPRLDEVHELLVLGLDPPLRQGQTRYPFVVFQLAHDFEVEVELNVESAKLERLFDGRVQPSYDSPVHTVLAQLLTGVTDRKLVGPADAFQSAHGLKGIKCSLKTSEAMLYPLEKAFLFIPKPPTLIPHADISSVVVSRVAGGAASVSRTFEMKFNMRTGADYTFNNINREEYPALANFMLGKNITVKNELNESGGTRLAELGDSATSGDDDAGSDAGARKRKRSAASVSNGSDEESEDADFQAPSSGDSDVAEEYSENASESGESGGSEEESGDDAGVKQE